MSTIDPNTAFELTKVFAASQEELFNAFIDDAILKKMWGVSSITVDARPNGKTRATLEYDGENWNFTITYKEVIPHEKLRWIVHFDRFPSKEVRATVWFKKAKDGTEVLFRQENFESSQERDEHKKAIEHSLKALEELVGKK